MPSTKSKTKPKSSTPSSPIRAHWEFDAIGTHWWIGLYQPVAAAKLQALRAGVGQLIRSFDQAYSRFITDSWVARMAQVAGSHDLPGDALPLLRWYRELYNATDGAVTPLVGGLLADAGYDASYSFKPGTLRLVPAWDDVMAVQGTKLVTQQPVELDFGAAGKGYLVDLVADYLQQQGIMAYCVDAGGDMRVRTPEPLRVGLEDPADAKRVIGVATITNDSLCGSAPNRRVWANGTMHHTLNPHTKAPANNIAAVWVVARDCMIADGLTTALHFVSPEKLRGIVAFECLILYSDARFVQSAGFPGDIYT